MRFQSCFIEVEILYKYLRIRGLKQVTVRLVLELFPSHAEMKWQILSGKPSVLLLLLHVTISSSAMPYHIHEQLATANYQPSPSTEDDSRKAAFKAVKQLLNFDNGVAKFCTNFLQLMLTLLGLPIPQCFDSVSEFLRSSLGVQVLSTRTTIPATPVLKLFNSS